jgi:tripeptidyl-peptidase-1
LIHLYVDLANRYQGEYAFQVCSLFAQLAARGVSVIFSAGDTGVGIACESNDGKHTVRFAPNFPASCPFVTSVGGTYGHSPEIAAAFSSGGFSNYFPRPSWQDFAVTAWQPFSVDDETNKGPYQLKGRAYPDVAAQSVRFAVWNKGVKTMIEGTR